MNEDIRNIFYQILDSIALIDETLQGIGFEDFTNDRKRKILVTENLIKISELFEILKSDELQFTEPLEKITTHNLFKMINDANFGIADEITWKLSKIDMKRVEKHLRQLLK